MILVCSILILWDWYELRQHSVERPKKQARQDSLARAMVLLLGIWLLRMCDSKTSIVCLSLAAGIFLLTRLRFLQQRLAMLGVLVLGAVLVSYALEQQFHFKDTLLEDLGRNSTLTGRTDVWRELRNAGTDPVLGTGFMSFWDDERYRSILPDWIACSAHNGYLEIYLAGGWVGVSFLSVMILGVGWRVNKALSGGADYAVFRFAVFVVALVANYTESNFACMTPLGFLFLLSSIGYAPKAVNQRIPDATIVVEGAPAINVSNIEHSGC
jgi:O-antigen ligase